MRPARFMLANRRLPFTKAMGRATHCAHTRGAPAAHAYLLPLRNMLHLEG
ncbi:hypothetical protein [Azospirillum largimobile]